MKLQIITDSGEVLGTVYSEDMKKKATLAGKPTLARIITEEAIDLVIEALNLESGEEEGEERR